MFWLFGALRPSSFVELGTHYGYSFFAACQAAHEMGLSTTCTAVDTWQGDDHAGRYGEEVYETVRRQAERYPALAKLKRMTFDEAVGDFADASIDLLHIDGRHFYEDVLHDWTAWKPKVSPRGVVLFHDTRVMDRGFGVHKFWAEIRHGHPGFEFFHQHGLGVLGFGKDQTSEMRKFFAATTNEEVVRHVRLFYARLGTALPPFGDAAPAQTPPRLQTTFTIGGQRLPK